jgi:hypothetical protein
MAEAAARGRLRVSAERVLAPLFPPLSSHPRTCPVAARTPARRAASAHSHAPARLPRLVRHLMQSCAAFASARQAPAAGSEGAEGQVRARAAKSAATAQRQRRGAAAQRDSRARSAAPAPAPPLAWHLAARGGRTAQPTQASPARHSTSAHLLSLAALSGAARRCCGGWDARWAPAPRRCCAAAAVQRRRTAPHLCPGGTTGHAALDAYIEHASLVVAAPIPQTLALLPLPRSRIPPPSRRPPSVFPISRSAASLSTLLQTHTAPPP